MIMSAVGKFGSLKKVQKLTKGEWEPYTMKYLQIDDVFRMFESSGVAINKGQMWIVLDMPYFNFGSYHIKCEPIVGVIQA